MPRSILLSLIACFMSVTGTAAAWDEPDHWSEIGTVEMWVQYDLQFYRAFDDNRFLDRSQFRLDQRELYDRTGFYNPTLPAASVEEFLTMDLDSQQERTKQAGRKLDLVKRFLDRVRDQVNKTRSNLPSDYGNQVSDPAVMGDLLDNLGDAVGLDPSNPYTWHLLSFFAACTGDVERSHMALGGAVEALSHVPRESMTDLKRRVVLDRAWLLRDVGLFTEALADLETAVKLGRRDVEALLLQGLIAAQTGNAQDALRMAAELRKVEVRKFPADFNSATFKPEITDTQSWKKVPSNYLQRWITALLHLQQGEMDAARMAFGKFSTTDIYPFGWRFWNEAGLIYDMTGRPLLAVEAWNTARISRHYVRYLVYKPYVLNLELLTGNNAKAPYYLGFDRFYLAGSRLAYGASLVGKVANAEAEDEKQMWALRALDQLEVCQRNGTYPGQASVLQGQVYYLLDDVASALAELREAVPLLEGQGYSDPATRVQQDIQALAANQKGGEGTVILSQSGRSRGRWDPATDVAATEAALKAAFAADPDDTAARLELARFSIRNGKATQGRELVAGLFKDYKAGNGEPPVAAVGLMLEADRILGQTELALFMVDELNEGRAHLWNDPGLWTLTGFICESGGYAEAAHGAISHAAELDPGNLGLQLQLMQMGD